MDISSVSAAFAVDLAEDGRVARARIGFGGVAATPVRARECERFLAGRAWSRETVEKAVEVLRGEFSPISDLRAGAEYRRALSANLLRKFFGDTAEMSPMPRR